MTRDTTFHLLLAVIAILLAVLAFGPLVSPPAANAAPEEAPHFYIEPGTTTLRSPGGDRSVIGKVVVDLRNGNVWGFPTLTSAPYPVDSTKPAPPVSQPIYLGKYDFSAIRQNAE
ncbi:MAG: hypothetical protein AB7O65_11045 [Candidatus Korobacteraceae bacterium]